MSSRKLITSSIIFFAGIALGLALAILTVWSNYEAVRYFFTGAPYGPFGGMDCPVFVTRSETATISASIFNANDQTGKPVYKVEISGPLGRSFKEQISIPPHQAQEVTWTVSSDDIDLGSFIFSKVTVLAFIKTPTREATCGIFVVNFAGLTGEEVLGISLVVSLLAITIGLVLWESQMKVLIRGFMQPQSVRRALAFAVLLAMLSGLMGWWTAGILFIVLAVLLLAIMVLGAVRG